MLFCDLSSVVKTIASTNPVNNEVSIISGKL